MSASPRLLAWLKRQLPLSDARHVDVRDGDELVARISVPRGRAACEEMAEEIAAAVDASDSRSLAIVAVDRQGLDVVAMTMGKPGGKREARAPSAFLGSVMRDNEALRAALMATQEQTMRALLSENTRLSEQVSRSEGRQLESWQLLEELTSMRAARDLEAREANTREERSKGFLDSLKNEWAPAVVRYLETGRGSNQTLARVFQDAIVNAPEELAGLVGKLRPEVAEELNAAIESSAKADMLASLAKRGNGTHHA
jgi:hypothetical protein